MYHCAWSVLVDVDFYNASNGKTTTESRTYCVLCDFDAIQDTLVKKIQVTSGQETLRSIKSVLHVANHVAIGDGW